MSTTAAGAHQSISALAYDQLLALRETVLADQHPRIQLSAAAKARLRAAVIPESRLPNVGSRDRAGDDSLTSATRQTNERITSNKHAVTNNSYAALPASTMTSAKPATASGLDPIFLTKSEDLVRAERQLKRQRIERQLKEEWERKKHASRDKEFGTEYGALDRLSELFEEAIQTVKPISGLRAAPKPLHIRSESFDENSYYSSQANDWSSEPSVASDAGHSLAANNMHPVVAQPQASLPALPGLASSASFYDTRTSSTGGLTQPPVHLQPALTGQREQLAATSATQSISVPHTEMSLDDESDYSPPAPERYNDGDADGEGEGGTVDLNDNDDESEYEPHNTSATVAPLVAPQYPQYQAFTSELTQMAALQPARISPLAVTKVPGLGSHVGAPSPMNGSSGVRAPSKAAFRGIFNKIGNTPAQSTVQSTAQSTASISEPSHQDPPMTKKQRRKAARAANRDQKKKDTNHAVNNGNSAKKRKRDQPEQQNPKPTKSRRVSGRQRSTLSPPPIVKDEPVSPPPFSASSGIPHFLQGPMVEGGSNSLANAQPQYQRQPLQPAGQVRYASTNTPSLAGPHPYAQSPIYPPKTRQANQDLRRVASLQAANLSYAPTPRVYSPVGPYRQSHVPFQNSPQAEQPTFQEELARVAARPVQQHAPPPQHPGYESEASEYEQRPAASMAPPARVPPKVVTDQYGNKYYAVDAHDPPPRPSVAPSTPYQDATRNRAYSRAPTIHQDRPETMAYGDPTMTPMRPPATVHRPAALLEQYAPIQYGQAPMYYSHDDGEQVSQLGQQQARPQYHRAVSVAVPPEHANMPPPRVMRAPSLAGSYPPPVEYGSYGYQPGYPVGPSQHALHEPIGYAPETPALPRYARYATDQPAPIYDPAPPRAYSTRPEIGPPMEHMPRQVSVAPGAGYYPHQEYVPPPVRAVSVMPTSQYAPGSAQAWHEYPMAPPPNVRYG